jgi:cytochrome P450
MKGTSQRRRSFDPRDGLVLVRRLLVEKVPKVEIEGAVKNRRVFIPFGFGVHGCVGKQLALHEMRFVIARVRKAFDIRLGDSYNELEWKVFGRTTPL